VNQPWPELKALFWYDLIDDPSGYSWGLLESSETPKPQYSTYASVIQTLGPCDGSTGGGGAGGGTSSSGTGGAGGTASSSGTGGAGGTASSSGTGGTTSGSSSGAGNDGSTSDDGGCGCTTTGGAGGRLGAFGLAGWLALWCWRRRRV